MIYQLTSFSIMQVLQFKYQQLLGEFLQPSLRLTYNEWFFYQLHVKYKQFTYNKAQRRSVTMLYTQYQPPNSFISQFLPFLVFYEHTMESFFQQIYTSKQIYITTIYVVQRRSQPKEESAFTSLAFFSFHVVRSLAASILLSHMLHLLRTDHSLCVSLKDGCKTLASSH